AIEKVLFGEDEYEKIRKRKLIIQGLVPTSLEKELMVERYFKNKAFEALCLKFHEKFEHYDVKPLQKEEEIDEGGKATRSRKRQKKDEKEKNEDAVKETKQEKFQRIFNDAKSILFKWISASQGGLAFCRPAL
ncbi:19476_t:CDS:2, partial [Gigaspora rosea]